MVVRKLFQYAKQKVPQQINVHSQGKNLKLRQENL